MSADIGAAAGPEVAALWFGGDLHLGAGAGGSLEGILAMVGGASGVVNLEGPITDGLGRAVLDGPRVWLANPSDTGRFLAHAGVVGASVVNNHADDEGPEGRIRTLAALRAAGVAPLGTTPATRTVGGVPVTLLAYDLPRALPVSGAPTGVAVPATLAADLAGAGGVRVVAFHVSAAPSYLPTPTLRAAVDAAVHNGADIVVAHGTHTLGPVERRGDTVIAWGLGNLLFDCACTDATEGLVVRVELAAPHAATVLPIAAGLGGAPATLAPDADGVFDLLDAIGSSGITRRGGVGTF